MKIIEQIQMKCPNALTWRLKKFSVLVIQLGIKIIALFLFNLGFLWQDLVSTCKYFIVTNDRQIWETGVLNDSYTF
jgi:hypothetical protein